MAANIPYQLQVYDADVSNLQVSYIPNSGSQLTVPKAEEKTTVSSICDHIEQGRIDVSRVNQTRVAKVLMRHFVDRQMHSVAPANGQRPSKVTVKMSATVAALATNVTSIKRQTLTYMTMGGVETKKEFMLGLNQLNRVLGPNALTNFQELLTSTHEYAISNDDAVVRGRIEATTVNHARNLRDALCVRLGPPASLQTQMANLRRNTRQLEQSLAECRQSLAQSEQNASDLRQSNRDLRRAAKRARQEDSSSSSGSGSNSDNSDDDDDDKDNRNRGSASADQQAHKISPAKEAEAS